VKSFEERLTRLETLNEKMKKGDIPLDEAVSLFEEGIKLAKGLEKELSKIERRIEILVNEPETPEEEPNLELFDDLNTEKSTGDQESSESGTEGGSGEPSEGS
jgi:exodeoxyribonuclease VII small subunit